MLRTGSGRQWNVRPSRLAGCTDNPIRKILEDLQIRRNPGKPFIPLSGVMTYGAETWTLTVRLVHQFKVAQRAIERTMLRVSLKDRIRNEVIRQRTKIVDIAQRMRDPTVFGNLSPPVEVLNAVHDSLKLRESRSYSSMVGHYEARKAIAKYSGLQGDISPDDVIICSGCSHAIELVQSTLAEAGQNIIVPRPGYSIHKTLGEGLGIQIKYYDLLPDDNWKVDLMSLESHIDDNTAAIVVNNPSNPCGSVYSKEHLLEILVIASRHRVPIIADEIYEHFVFSGQQFIPISALSTDVPVLTCSGISKRFLVPGWRLGWIIIHDRNNILGKDFHKAFSNMASRILGASSLIQQALPRILECTTHSYFDEMLSFLEHQAKLLCRELQKAPGLRPIMPQGSMYMLVEVNMSLFPRFENELQFIMQLCAEQSVLCLPSQCFSYPGFIRVVLTVPEDVLLEACSRITAFCKQYMTPDQTARKSI